MENDADNFDSNSKKENNEASKSIQNLDQVVASITKSSDKDEKKE
jgi:hypothetical protein